MGTERRYREDEVKEIFDLATSAEDHGPPVLPDEDGLGLTLQELQEIGLQVGVEPRQVAAAAMTVDAKKDALPRRTLLGMPISVGRVIQLPRALTDREWELMVVELRETFRARGRVASQGGIREWTNGNLHAFLEPTETGHRLRLGTLKGTAMALNGMGVIGLAVGLISLPFFGLTGGDVLTPLMWAGAGGVALASNFLNLPRWAREREEQMAHIAARLDALLGNMPADASEPSPPPSG